ncbi:DnaJ domain-containing protein [Halalkalicoccus jeotgali]|uniref:J domain-containing protein n=1 Tax=Halalkalicoccus jeotgali (strain DSM 18796 / CECT 7217 / JCM 14584 / KCTC 4019 / B3) TaxID=795797 RepID=D8J2N6_HALJB|nr:DnaJ domain-containing protein [Halalkalicoccus jeotgali]ADJ14993.1 hypothetical protein HacjB3_08040 [Halalkalicoccus jeotgali B3]ELY34991.1 hypothetical protein C497_14682 [Halalkalicoccus jeotgali B3]
METLYDVLGVDPNADAAAIRAAYREGAKRHHPDAADGDAATFRRLTTARDVLLDERRRERYDSLGHRRYARHHLGEERPAGESTRGRRQHAEFDRSSRQTSRPRRGRPARPDRREGARRGGTTDGRVAVSTYWPVMRRAGLVLGALLVVAFVLAALSL